MNGKGMKKVNRKTKALWNRCMKVKTDQSSSFVTMLVSNARDLPSKVNTDVNTLELVVQECGTRKDYSEYVQLKEIIELTTKIDWQARFKDAKIKK